MDIQRDKIVICTEGHPIDRIEGLHASISKEEPSKKLVESCGSTSAFFYNTDIDTF